MGDTVGRRRERLGPSSELAPFDHAPQPQRRQGHQHRRATAGRRFVEVRRRALLKHLRRIVVRGRNGVPTPSTRCTTLSAGLHPPVSASGSASRESAAGSEVSSCGAFAPSSADRQRRAESPLATVVQVWQQHVAHRRELRLEIEGLLVLLPASAAVSSYAARSVDGAGEGAGGQAQVLAAAVGVRLRGPHADPRPRTVRGIRVPLVLLTLLGRASCSDTYLARARRHPSRFSGGTP